MPYRRCFVEGCPNENYKQKKGLTDPDVGFFRPSVKVTADIRQQWYRNVPPRGDGILLDFSRKDHHICHLHFEEEQYERDHKYTINGEVVLIPRRARWALVLDAVPSKFPPSRGRNWSKRAAPSRPLMRKRKLPLSAAAGEVEVDGHNKVNFTFDCDENTSPGPETNPLREEASTPQKEYYCAICLNDWTAGSDILESLNVKETVYKQFVAVVTRYLRLTLKDPIFNGKRESPVDKGDSCWCRTLCDNCFSKASAINKLFTEQEQIRMKLNGQLVKVYQLIRSRKWDIKQAKIAKRVGIGEEVKSMVEVCHGIRSKKNTFFTPRVLLKRMPSSHSVKTSGAVVKNTRAPVNNIDTPIRRTGPSSLEPRTECETKSDAVIAESSASACPSPAVSSLNEEDPMERNDADVDVTITPPTTAVLEPSTLEEVVEPKEEIPSVDNTSSVKEVPFMSSEYIGKYKIVCKLRNIKTGKTCVGVVAKTAISNKITESTNSSGPICGPSVPRVISVELPKKRVIKRAKSKIKYTLPSGPPYKCQVEGCTKEFHTRAMYVRHYRNHQRRWEVLQEKAKSGEIPKKMARNKKRKRGRTKVTGGPLEPYDVPESSRKSETEEKGALFRFRCQVTGCKFKFRSESALTLHGKVTHTPIQCHFCSLTPPTLEQLIAHEKAEHGPPSDSTDPEVSPHMCPRCNQVTSEGKHSLRNHYAKAHLKLRKTSLTNNITKMACTLCQFTTRVSVKYMQHLKKCYGETPGESIIQREFPHECSTCGRRYRVQTALRKHHRAVHEGPPESQRKVFQCNLCQKKFTLRYRYETHMRKHAQFGMRWQKKPPPKDPDSTGSAVCDLCGKAFETVAGMLRHRLWHDRPARVTPPARKPKPPQPKIPCELCGKLWPNRGMLKYHMRRVHPQEAHRFELAPGEGVVCHHCGKVYAHKSVLHVHLMRYCPGTRANR